MFEHLPSFMVIDIYQATQKVLNRNIVIADPVIGTVVYMYIVYKTTFESHSLMMISLIN